MKSTRPLSNCEVLERSDSNDWKIDILGRVTDIRYGLGQPPEQSEDGVPMIRATNIKRGRIVENNLICIKREAIPERRNPYLKTGDIIVVRSGAYTGDVAMITSLWEGSVAGYDLIVSVKEGVDPSFCAFYLLSDRAQNYFRSQKDRSAQSHLNRQQLRATPIPIPTICEQRCIAAVLSSVQRAIEHQEQLIALTTELKKALIHKLFTEGTRHEPQKKTEIGLVPESWKVVRIGELVKFSSGKTKPKDTTIGRDTLNNVPVYGGDGVLGYSSEALFDNQLLILGRVGEYCRCAHITEKRCWVTDNALYSKEIMRDVNLAYLRNHFEYLNLNQYSNKMGQPLITQGVINDVKFGLPTKEEQSEIGQILSTIDSKIEEHKEKKGSLSDLFRALLHRLMTAQIRVNDIDLSELGIESQTSGSAEAAA
jgi:type I restriction enzyme S subunit